MSTAIKTRVTLHQTPDEGWSWVIALSCCAINAIIFGVYRTYGVIFVSVLSTYNVSRETASWPFSLCLTIFHMTGLISGALSSYFTTRSICIAGCLIASTGITLCYFTTNVWQVGILIGLVKGFGMGLVGTQTPVIINQYFVKYRATASGIALAGGTIGSFIFPPLVKLVLNQYSLHGCFLILGAIMLNTVPIALLLRPPIKRLKDQSSSIDKSTRTPCPNVESSEIVPSNKLNCMLPLPSMNKAVQADGFIDVDSSPKSLRQKLMHLSKRVTSAASSNLKLIQFLFQNPFYLILCATQISFTWGWTTFVMVVVDYAVDNGIEMSDAVLLLSAFAGADLMGRLGSGWISDKGIVKRKNVATTSILSIGILLGSLPFCTSSFSLLLTVSFLLGLCSGSIMILFSILLVEYVGIERMPIALGTSTFTCGMATMLRPAVIGYFRDAHDSYNGLFAFLSFMCLASGLLWFIEPAIKLFRKEPLSLPSTQRESKEESLSIQTHLDFKMNEEPVESPANRV